MITKGLWLASLLVLFSAAAKAEDHGAGGLTPAPLPVAPPPRCLSDRLLAGHGHWNMTVDRGLSSYVGHFGASFASALTALGENDHWLDGGSGESLAIEQYIRGQNPEIAGESNARGIASTETVRLPPRRARATGVTVGLDRQPPNDPRWRILKDRPLEQIPDAELTEAPYGRACLITDVYGAWAYSNRPDLVLRKYLDNLAEGGSVFLASSDFGNRVETADGRSIALFDWLRGSVSGIDVTVIRQEPVKGSFAVRLARNRQPLHVPVLAEQRRTDACPPSRYFEEE